MQVNNQATNSQVGAQAGTITGGVHFYQGLLDRRTSRMALLTLLLGVFGFIPLVFLPGIIMAIVVMMRIGRSSPGRPPSLEAQSTPGLRTQEQPPAEQAHIAGNPASPDHSAQEAAQDSSEPGTADAEQPTPHPDEHVTHEHGVTDPVSAQANPTQHAAASSPPPAWSPAEPTLAGAGSGAVAAGSGLLASKAVAMAMVILGLLFSLGWAGIYTFVFVVAMSLPSAEQALADCRTPPTGTATICTFQPGDCFEAPNDSAHFITVDITSCDEPHDSQIIGAYTADDGEWPGWDSIAADASERCGPVVERNVDQSAVSEQDSLGWAAPDNLTWDAGYRTVFCTADNGGSGFTESVLVPDADLSIPTG